MPNPLSVVTSSPTATATTNATVNEPGEDTGADFAAVLKQHGDGHSDEIAGPNPKVEEPEPDADAEGEDIDPKGDAEVLADPPQAELQVSQDVKPEVVEPVGHAVQTTSPDPHDQNSEEDRRPDTQATFVRLDTENQNTRKVTQNVRNDTVERISPIQTPEGPPRPELAKSKLQSAETPAVAVVGRAVKPALHRQDAHHSPAPVSTHQSTSTAERALSIAQMQLFAPEKSRTQTDAQTVLDVEDVQQLREAVPVSTSRDSAATTHFLATTARAETARAIAGQMAAVINAQPQSGAVEIALNPEELGRVSIVLNGRDDGLHMTIAAERPETLDMMRRHLSVLEEEFKNLGLGNLSFDLGTPSDSKRDRSDFERELPADSAQTVDAPAKAPPLPRTGLVGRIDMRL
ncbi:flagellar hook-length control protein FliK [Ruegeria sp. Ofav3-42]|uniref:flagellar hook-length control protein FliK n=1 Tax=Ruegeria sp. Ofav3-42 TaxID=2917759 RepID=UPI001EF6B2E9|nr:flagellar hook-length control protein FliK [Ruegeria sp. Ofav3-42]MCG7520615.1 flagellar hook-length control protein FliK [Ruegeria sp. Ofav3-42]